MPTLVQKYGGTSVETPDHLLDVARRILEEKRQGHRLLVVVSAMGQTTDDLVSLAKRVTLSPPRREMDMLLTAGERISMTLLAMALETLGVEAISFTGSQSGIITDDRHSDARIVEIRPMRIEDELSEDRVVIVAGFQGVSLRKEVTTLGRGGSDTSAVALAIHFGSSCCEIFTDVHGVLTADPRIVPHAETLTQIGHETAIVLSHLGAQVLFQRAVILARKFRMPLLVRSTHARGKETWIGRPTKETTMEQDAQKPQPPMESNRILSVALETKCVSVEIGGKLSADQMLGLISGGADAPPWLWVETQQVAKGSMIRAVAPESATGLDLIESKAESLGVGARIVRDLAVVSLVGEGILARPSLLAEAISHLTKSEIPVAAARSASLSLSFVVESGRAEEAVRILHKRFVETA